MFVFFQNCKNIKSRNANIWKRCAWTFRGGYANFQLRAAFVGRVLAVLLNPPHICALCLPIIHIHRHIIHTFV